MSWRDEAATEKQIKYLAEFGYVADRPLSKGEASDLISQFSEDDERCRIRDDNQRVREEGSFEEDQKQAFRIHQQLEEALKELANAQRGEIQDWKEEVTALTRARIDFWKDTFRDIADMADFCEQAGNLSAGFGFRFKIPTTKQIQSILDALDKAWAVWDRDKPTIFFETLELNFPELLRR